VLLHEDQDRLVVHITKSPEAYDELLKGRQPGNVLCPPPGARPGGAVGGSPTRP
jgi:hypothetical protein